MSSPPPPAAIVFDVDGTLLDSATGIVAGFAHALRALGMEPPDEAELRSDLGPPVDLVLERFGVDPERLDEGRLAYRDFYRTDGLQQSLPYPGVVDLLDALVGRGIPLGTATAKRTETAQLILDHHGLGDQFSVINGTTDTQRDKPGTLARTIELLGVPADRGVWMVGDRHSDLAAAHACGATAVAVTWGYGPRAELIANAPDLVVDTPAELLDLIGGRRR